ncbi:MAG: helix-turn-helix transcriptional regulator [Clostridium sp.]|nr:helix-turn-helix transcriptional regulator [Clostridium sp.]
MKAEKYILDYMMNRSISVEQVECDTGINLRELSNGKKDLMADEFLQLCVYLGVRPEDILT